MALMLKILLLLCGLSFVHGLGGLGGMRSGGKASKYTASRPMVGAGYSQYSSQNTSKDSLKNQTSSSKRGLGISAWGLIALVISIVLCSMGAYYFIIFYPLLCKKQRNYDKMELTPV